MPAENLLSLSLSLPYWRFISFSFLLLTLFFPSLKSNKVDRVIGKRRRRRRRLAEWRACICVLAAFGCYRSAIDSNAIGGALEDAKIDRDGGVQSE